LPRSLVLRLHNQFPVVVASAGGRWATAIEYGATEFIRKPFKVQEIWDVVIRADYEIRIR
jgi:FixJ family two-component response regulator